MRRDNQVLFSCFVDITYSKIASIHWEAVKYNDNYIKVCLLYDIVCVYVLCVCVRMRVCVYVYMCSRFLTEIMKRSN